MSYLADSMVYERAHAEVANLRHTVSQMRTRAEEEARINGEPLPNHYDLILDNLYEMQKQFRETSDVLYKAHKEMHEPTTEGIYNLANAVVISAIQDYEEAISSGRRGAGGTIRAIKRFAETDAEKYTTADVRGILSRIDAIYPKFREYAKANCDGIKKMTREIQNSETNGKYSTSKNKYRCPFCGGGLYYSRETNESRIKCGSCCLSAKIENRKEEANANC